MNSEQNKMGVIMEIMELNFFSEWWALIQSNTILFLASSSTDMS